LSKIFDKSMIEFANLTKNPILDSYDFSSFNKLVDVGGGYGNFLIHLLKANPNLRGVLFERPSVIEGAKQHIEEAGIAERCELVGGNFFLSLPQGGDAYLMTSILLDWNDEKSTIILQNCHRAMAKDGTLLLGEMIMPAGNEPYWGKLFDLNLM